MRFCCQINMDEVSGTHSGRIGRVVSAAAVTGERYGALNARPPPRATAAPITRGQTQSQMLAMTGRSSISMTKSYGALSSDLHLGVRITRPI